LSENAYAAYKKTLVTSALASYSLADVLVKDPIIIPPHNRRRCNLKAARVQDRIQLGYHARKSHDIVDISVCPLVVPEIEMLIPALRSCLKGVLRNKQKGVDLIIDGLKSLAFEQTENLIAFGVKHDLARISLQNIDSIEPLVTFRTPVISYGGVSVECDANGFMQASMVSDKILTKLVLDSVPQGVKRAVDLFCGRGTFTLPLSGITKVDAFELDLRALTTLEKAKNKNSKPVNTYIRNLFEDPLNPKELENYDFAVINPPRAGAFKQCLALAESQTSAIAMVSCDPRTFARDAKVLMEGGYKLDEVTPVDQFLWSNHIEVVGTFRRYIQKV
jgi:23S rRNA (uracil1939-C5)-methyltransferase